MWNQAMVFFVFLLHGALPAPHPPKESVLVDWSQYNHHGRNGKGTYAFGYDIEDPQTNNVQFRSEERHANGTITGSFGYLEPDGNIHMVHYVADDRGYRAVVEDSARGGSLKPIPVLGNSDYVTYGLSPQMVAALKHQKIFQKQSVHEKRKRPFDQLSEEEKIRFQYEQTLKETTS